VHGTIIGNGYINSAIHGLTFHKSMLRQNEPVDLNTEEKPMPDRADAAMEALARRKAASRRTAWIIGAIAVAFFIASLVHGHLVGISNWVPPGH
jgi:hypothetical protein